MLYGLRYGLVGAMTHLAAIPVGLALVIRFSAYAAAWLQSWLPHWLAVLGGWFLITVMVGLAVALLLRLANAVLSRAGLQLANRLIGGWTGLVGAVLVLALVQLALMHIAPMRWNSVTDGHVSLRCLRAAAQEIEGRLPAPALPKRVGE